MNGLQQELFRLPVSYLERALLFFLQNKTPGFFKGGLRFPPLAALAGIFGMRSWGCNSCSFRNEAETNQQKLPRETDNVFEAGVVLLLCGGNHVSDCISVPFTGRSLLLVRCVERPLFAAYISPLALLPRNSCVVLPPLLLLVSCLCDIYTHPVR